jgi:hypothetical protein
MINSKFIKSATTELPCYQQLKESHPLRHRVVFNLLDCFLKRFAKTHSIRLKKSAFDESAAYGLESRKR